LAAQKERQEQERREREARKKQLRAERKRLRQIIEQDMFYASQGEDAIRLEREEELNRLCEVLNEVQLKVGEFSAVLIRTLFL
jgi:hypothetical protein